MQRRFVIFINPISGTQNKAGLKQLIQRRLDEQGFMHQFLETNAEADYAFLPTKIETENITDVIICGGDGTVNQVGASLLNVDVNVGIIPMGSGNGLAFAAGIPKNPGKALDVIIQGKAAYIDAFYINNIFSCMLCGLGFDAQVAHDFAKQSSRGLSSYIKQGIRNFFIARPYPFSIMIHGIEIKTQAYFISIANSNQFGNHVTIAPRASLSDGLLDIVIVNKMNKLNMVYALLKQVRLGKVQEVSQKGFHSKNIQYLQTSSLAIHNPSMAPLHIDGEPVATHKKFQVDIIEKAFRLIQA
ncbi:MAG TPA: YegS/Rv2252/BmrU family lipid kinase [Ferruginibacter sp.]|nr:YegS/Rv2252/BmrU family lipid kinase [Ferruginibacter sp.]